MRSTEELRPRPPSLLIVGCSSQKCGEAIRLKQPADYWLRVCYCQPQMTCSTSSKCLLFQEATYVSCQRKGDIVSIFLSKEGPTTAITGEESGCLLSRIPRILKSRPKPRCDPIQGILFSLC